MKQLSYMLHMQAQEQKAVLIAVDLPLQMRLNCGMDPYQVMLCATSHERLLSEMV